MKRLIFILIVLTGVYNFTQSQELWQHYDSSNSALTSDYCYDILVHDNTIWVCNGTGIFKMINGESMVYNHENYDVPRMGIYNIYLYEGTQSQILIGGKDTISSFDGENWQAEIDVDGYINGLVKDEDGILWFTLKYSNHEELYSYDGENISTHYLNTNHPDKELSEILLDSDGSLWIVESDWEAFLYDGIIHYDKQGNYEYYSMKEPPFGQNTSKINDIAFDKEHNLWILDHSKGIFKMDASNWTLLNSWGHDEVPMPAKIAFDSNNTPWFLDHYRKLCKIVENEIVEVECEIFKPTGWLYDIFIDENDNKYIIDLSHGLYIYTGDGEQTTNLQKPDCNFALHPNPASSNITLDFGQQYIGSFVFKLYNLRGKLAYQSKQKRQTIALPENLVNGTYIYKIETPESTYSGKLIIEK